MQFEKHQALRPLFVPVLTKPSGDRSAAFAVFQALKELQGPGFAVAASPVEAYDESGQLKTQQAIEREIDAATKTASLSYPHEAVVFYTGHELVQHLAEMKFRKFATTHVHPQELLSELKGNKNDGQSWNHHSLRDELGLDMLACPAHMATDIASGILDDPDVLWMFGVSSQRVPESVDLKDDEIFATAHEKPLFVVSMPTPSDDPQQDSEIIDLIVRLVHHEETLGDREIILVDNPRSGVFKDVLLDALAAQSGKEYKIVSEMGAFAKRVLPAIKKHPMSKIFLPGDSASVMTESIETLPWHHIIVQTSVIKDEEQRKLAPFFFEHGRIQVLDDQGKLKKPPSPNDASVHAAYDVARAAIDRFTGKNTEGFMRPAFLRRA